MFFLALLLFAFTVFAQSPAGSAPPATLILDAGRAENTGAYPPNSRGVYPVRIRWQKPAVPDSPAAETPSAYHLYRSENAADGFVRITQEPIPASAETGGVFSWIDENPSAEPGRFYYYRVLALDSRGQGALFSETLGGYGALTHEQYLQEYNKTIASSHRKMTYMNKPGALGKLGTETKAGVVSGSVYYRARISGLGAKVVIRYDRYADFYAENSSIPEPCFVLSGNTDTIAFMDQSGRMDGVVNVSGMYPGRVFYDKVEIKRAAASGGTYGVEPEGFPRRELSWTLGPLVSRY
jgi:hypothetical protein